MRNTIALFTLASTMAVASAGSAQQARCPEPKIRVELRWPSATPTVAPRPATTRCMNLAEFLAMRRARDAWRCTPPTATQLARCTAVNVSAARP